jgi:hypothetical protein
VGVRVARPPESGPAPERTVPRGRTLVHCTSTKPYVLFGRPYVFWGQMNPTSTLLVLTELPCPTGV